MNILQIIFKKILVTISSVMLLNLSFVYNVGGLKLDFSSNTYAQETTTTTYGTTSAGQTGSAELKGDGSSAFTGPDLALLVYIATAFVIYKLTTSCTSIAPDAWAAIAGVGIFLAGELMEMFSSTQKLEAKKIEYTTRGEDGKIDDEQYQALVSEKQAMDAIADSAEKRSKFQSASAVALAAAAGIATYNRAAELVAVGTCLGMTEAAIAAAQASTPVGTAQAVACKANLVAVQNKESVDQFPKDSEIMCGQKFSSMAVALSTSKTCTLSQESCSQELAMEKSNIMCCTKLKPEDILVDNSTLYTPSKFSVVTLLNYLIVNEAMAMEGMLGGIVGLVGGYVFAQSSAMNSFITSPAHRAYYWGGLSAYGFMVSQSTKKTAENAKKNSDILDQIIKKFEKSKRGLSVIARNGNSPTQIGGMINLGGGSQDLAIGDQLPCTAGVAQTNGATVTCPTSPFTTNTAFKANTNFPTGMNAALNALSDFTKQTEGQKNISSGAQGSIDTINANRSAVEGFLKKSQDAVNKTLLASKKPQINFAKEQSNLMSKLSNAAKSRLKKSNETPSSLFAKLGMRANSLADQDEKDSSKSGNKALVSVDESTGKGLVPVVDGSDNQFKFDFSDDTSTQDQFLDAKNAEFKANEEAAAKNTQMNGSDINKNKDESLFKVISGRYIKSGFKRLLDEL